MMQIKPVTDLRNKFTEIEKIVNTGQPVYLTKNGYGSMVVLSLETYSKLVEGVEVVLDKADKEAQENRVRYSHEEILSKLRGE